MKKLYRKGTVHPSPPNPIILSHYLSFLPSTILTLTAALSPEDREVLAYLISRSYNNNTNLSSKFSNHRKTSPHKTLFYTKNSGTYHPPLFNCDCFCCYMSYWVRWDSSPNRQLIHEIIDAFEDWLLLMQQGRSNNCKKYRKRSKGNNGSGEELELKLKRSQLMILKEELGESTDSVDVDVEKNSSGGSGGGEEQGLEKGSVRRFVSFIGERIWGVLGR